MPVGIQSVGGLRWSDFTGAVDEARELVGVLDRLVVDEFAAAAHGAAPARRPTSPRRNPAARLQALGHLIGRVLVAEGHEVDARAATCPAPR